MTDPLTLVADPEFRAQLTKIRALYGQTVLSEDLQSQVRGFGSQKGIYKPSGASHALWVRQTSKGVYPDEDLAFHPDGSWTYRYSPEGRQGQLDMTLDTNRALLKSSSDGIPVGVFRQASDQSGKTAYEVLGLAYVESFDGAHFVLRGEPIDVDTAPIPERFIPNFEPFERGLPSLSEALRVDRDRRFGVVVRRLYHEKCSLCNLGFRIRGKAVALDAAHIIPVEMKGKIGDVRNGILLCKNHHALFDQDAWTMDEDLRIRVAPDKGLRESALDNHILSAEGMRLPNLPTEPEDQPALAAIRWRMESFEKAWS